MRSKDWGRPWGENKARPAPSRVAWIEECNRTMGEVRCYGASGERGTRMMMKTVTPSRTPRFRRESPGRVVSYAREEGADRVRRTCGFDEARSSTLGVGRRGDEWRIGASDNLPVVDR